jgi:hypothetical protein
VPPGTGWMAMLIPVRAAPAWTVEN